MIWPRSVQREDDTCLVTLEWPESGGRTSSGSLACSELEITEVGAPVDGFVWGGEVSVSRADAIGSTAVFGVMWVAVVVVTLWQYRSQTLV